MRPEESNANDCPTCGAARELINGFPWNSARRAKLAELGERVLEIIGRCDASGYSQATINRAVYSETHAAARSLGLLDEAKP